MFACNHRSRHFRRFLLALGLFAGLLMHIYFNWMILTTATQTHVFIHSPDSNRIPSGLVESSQPTKQTPTKHQTNNVHSANTTIIKRKTATSSDQAQYLLVDTIWEQLACGASNLLGYLQLANLLNRTAVLPFYSTDRRSSFSAFLDPGDDHVYSFLEVFSNSSVAKLQVAIPGLRVEPNSTVGLALKKRCTWVTIDFRDGSKAPPTVTRDLKGIRLAKDFNAGPQGLRGIFVSDNTVCIREFRGFSSEVTARSNWSYYIKPPCERGRVIGSVLPCLDLADELMAPFEEKRPFKAITIRFESIIRNHDLKQWIPELEECRTRILQIVSAISRMMKGEVVLFHDIDRSVSFKYDSSQLLPQLERIPNITFATCPEDRTPCAPFHLELASQAEFMVGIGQSFFHSEMRSNVQARSGKKNVHFIPNICTDDDKGTELQRICADVSNALRRAGYSPENSC